jgi:methionine synthase II (cobalamin-independent)
MFATLLGGLPRPPLDATADASSLVDAAVAAQVAAGLEPVSDAGWWGTRPAVEAWVDTSRLTDRVVKQRIDGPYSAGLAASASTWETVGEAATLAASDANVVLRDLAAAGCPVVEIHEPGLAEIGADPAAWERVADLHRIMTAGVIGTHLSLAITGGAIDPAGFETLLAAPFASFAVDLIAGPENWRFVRVAPGERGIICGAMGTAAITDEGPETLLWAASYAASSQGRGRDRVGLSTASSLASLPWDVATRKLERLGAAAQLVLLPADDLRASLDPRSIDARTAALGHGPKARRSGP